MRVAVIGAGTMGSGIAQVSAAAGHEVFLCDSQAAALDRARAAMQSSLDRFVAKERTTRAEADAALGRVHATTALADAVTDADVVIESIVEQLEVKQAVFTAVAEAAPAGALLGTNTSQLSITRIASVLGDRAPRLVGMHFFNPPVLMNLVELVRGLETSDAAVAEAEELSRGLGKETVVCRKDSPGFLTSRIAAVVRAECFHMLEEGVGTAADIDKALRLGLNFPMGPLELGDFNGLDTYLHALGGLHEAHGERFRPPVTLRNLVAAGRLGRKSGHGVYRYAEDGSKIDEGQG